MSIRVLLVDDTDDVRFLLRLGVEMRPGFEVVGEARDGAEALALAAATNPDIVILDREMPRLGGLEVLPRLRETCPTSVIVLFTAVADHELHRAAVSTGADAVRLKGRQSVDALIDELEGLLLPGDEGQDLVRLRVGPVSAAAARTWVANTRGILAALLRAPAEVPATVPLELLGFFGAVLEEWATVAEGAGDGSFFWTAAADVSALEDLVRAWAELDTLSDETLARLGCSWSPPEATPFFDALTTGVVSGLRRHEELKAVVRDLPADWARSVRTAPVRSTARP